MMDDRGQPVRVLNPAGFQDWPVRGDPRMEILVRRVGLAMQGGGTWKRIGIGLAVMVGYMVLAGGVVAFTRAVLPGVPRWMPLAAIVVAASIGGVWVVRWKAATNADAIAEVVLEEGLCPSCGYNFHGLAAAEDGCIVCPECSAAWQAARIARTAEFVAGAAPANVLSSLRSGAQAAGMWTTIDDRGRRVELAHPRLRKALRGARGHADWMERLKRARRGIGRAAIVVRGFGLVVVWAFVLGVVGLLGSIAWKDGPKAYGFCGAVSAVVILGGIAATRGNFCYPPRRTRNAILQEGLCPTCAGVLPGAGDDGLCVCPWCRSVWRLDAAGRERGSARAG